MQEMPLFIYLLIGAAAGTLAGLLGIGGTIILIPSLLWVFSIYLHAPSSALMHYVVGTSFAATIATTLFSLLAQVKRGSMSWIYLRQLLPGITVGTILGAMLASFLDTHVLKVLFGVFVILAALQMFFRFRESNNEGMPSVANRSIATLIIGLFSGLLGISGGSFTIPYLTYFRIDIRKAMAVSTGCGVIITLAGTLSFIITGWNEPNGPPWSTGYIYWPAALLIAAASPWFATLGATLSHRLPVVTLRKVFAGFLFVVGLDLLF